MLLLALRTIAICLIFNSIQVYGGYLITTPRRWTKGEEAKICAVLSDNPSVNDVLSIAIVDTLDDQEKTILQKDFSFTSGERNTCFRVNLPDEFIAKPRLDVTGTILGSELNYTKTFKISNNVAQTFVQTDKYLYKPSQEVQFRILTVIGPFLEVSKGNYPAMWAENPSGTRIWQALNVDNSKGLIHQSFTLTDEPEEGTYRIKVSTPYNGTVEKTFKVEDYVLPRYEVTINPPSYILGTTEVITFEVCAKYTFGQPVKGNLTLSVSNNGWGENKVTIEKEAPISGCESVNFTSTELAINGDNFFAYNLKASASVVEEGTNTLLIADKKSISISRTALRFNDVTVQEYLKPELPFLVEANVVFPDDSQAPNEPMEVCVREICKNFTTNANGLLKFALPPHISGSAVVRALNYGRIESGNSWRSIMYESNFVKTAKKYHSPSNSSMVIALDEKKINCTPSQDISFSLPVRFSAVNVTSAIVTVQVISRGQIQFFTSFDQKMDASGSLHIDDGLFLELPLEPVTKGLVRGHFTVPVVLPKTVSPKAKVLIWYVRDDGEVISDARTLDITECLLNDVKFSWSAEQVRPGDRATLSLSAEPLSLCSLGVVDKSVELLSSKKDSLTIKTLLDVADKANVGLWENIQVDDFEYCRKKENETKSVLVPSIILPEVEPEEVTITLEPPVDETTTGAEPQNLPELDPDNAAKLTGTESEAKLESESNADVGPESGSSSSNVPARRKRSFGWRPFYSLDVDSLHMFDNADVFVFSDYTLETRPCNSHYGHIYPMPMASDRVYYRVASGRAGGMAAAANNSPKKRTYFPETWLWELFTTGENGSIMEDHVLPDTVTEWVGKAVCVHPSEGVGISETASITTFRDFFVDLTLPATAKRGEVFPVKISVFNYLEEPLPVKVSLVQSEDFDILAQDSAQLGPGDRSSCIEAQDKVVHSIKIRPKASGDVNIAVEAYVDVNTLATCGTGTGKERSDIIIKHISVDFEGIQKEDTWTKYICSTDLETGEDSFETWPVSTPQEIVPDSGRGWVTVVGDLMGPTIENLGKLVKMPYGCGEQNMLNFAPNIFVMDYLSATNQSSEEITKFATRFMEKGYQRELNYRHSDGSYSAFGDSDPSGSTWLTAFVLKCFAQARPYITVDEEDLQLSASWFKKQQMENGCFFSVGKVLHKGMKGGLGKGKPSSPLLTSYVLISLLESGEDPTSAAVRESIFCIKSDNDTNPYSLAMKAYALALAKAPEAQAAIEELLAQAQVTSSSMYWKLPEKSNKGLSVETAAYAILALLAQNAQEYTGQARKIVKWINNKRNGQGGFVSTQDTILALQALADYEKVTPQLPLDALLLVDMNAHSESFTLKENNKFLTQRANIPSLPSEITLTFDGTGCILAQAVVRYNIPKPEPSEAFELSVNATTEPDNGCKTKRISACASYILPDLESNMAILEVDVMSGYIPDKRDLKQVVGTGKGVIKRYEVDGSKVMFYVDEFSSEKTCVSFRVLREFDVEDAKNGTVTVYDYYKPEYSLSQSYRLPASDECIETMVEVVEIKGGEPNADGVRHFFSPPLANL